MYPQGGRNVESASASRPTSASGCRCLRKRGDRMLPGKKYKPEDFVWIVWGRKWFIVIPAVIIGAATFAWSSQLPNRYLAQTTILIVPQRVPTNYVRPTVTADVSERLTFISQQILSRPRLEQMILDFNLYPEERAKTVLQDVVERMRTRDIKINIARPRNRREDTSSFTIGFESAQARTSLQVTERLTALFVQENSEDRAMLADSTTKFLQTELEEARRRLVEHEKKLETFRLRNAGRLPSQADSNLQLLQSAQTRLIGLSEAVSRDRDRLSALEGSLSALAATETAPAPPVRSAGPGAGPTAAQQLEAARATLAGLERRLKPVHPDVVDAKRRLAELEAKVEAEALQQPVSPVDRAVPQGAQGRTAAMQLEATELRQRLESRKKEEAQLQKLMASYATRIEAAPALESELTELMRDYTTLEETYSQLRTKVEESTLASKLERREIGEQFRIVDRARRPEGPFSPNRLRLNMLGLMAGLGFGLALVALLEYRDTSLKTDDDVLMSLGLPVLAVIPVMLTTRERQRTRTRRLLLAVSASAVSVLFVAAVVAWRFDLLPAWVR